MSSRRKRRKLPGFTVNTTQDPEKRKKNALQTFEYLENLVAGDDYEASYLEAEENFLGIFGKKNKEKRKKAFKKIGGFLKKAGQAVGDTVKKVGAIALAPVKWAALLPFKGAMKRSLQKEGVTPPKKLEALAQKFYAVKILGQKSYEFGPEHYDAEGNVEPATASVIISAILSFFKKIVGSKGKGENTPDNEELAGWVEGAANALLSGASEEGEEGIVNVMRKGANDGMFTTKSVNSSEAGSSGEASGGFDMKGLVPILVIALVAFVALKK